LRRSTFCKPAKPSPKLQLAHEKWSAWFFGRRADFVASNSNADPFVGWWRCRRATDTNLVVLFANKVSCQGRFGRNSPAAERGAGTARTSCQRSHSGIDVDPHHPAASDVPSTPKAASALKMRLPRKAPALTAIFPTTTVEESLMLQWVLDWSRPRVRNRR